jgi:hypothetical protein
MHGLDDSDVELLERGGASLAVLLAVAALALLVTSVMERCAPTTSNPDVPAVRVQ